MPKPFLVLILSLLPLLAHAEVYRIVMPDGSVVFTDEPPQGEQVEEVDVKPLQTYSAPTPKTSAAPAATPAAAPAKTEKPVTYTKLAFTTPLNDSAMHANSGEVGVALTIEPPLSEKDGHVIVITLDGKEVSKGGTGATLKEVERGTHTLGASVRDDNGNMLISAPNVVFTVHRRSILR